MSSWSSKNGSKVDSAWRGNLAAFLFFTLLTLVAAWPVVTNLNGVIVGDDNDIYINIWADWWTRKALTDPQISLWWTDYLFYPQGADLVYHSFSHLNTLTSLALQPLLGVLPAYNLTILLNLVLIGFSMFQLARYLTGSTTAAVVAGMVFAFNSHTLYQSAHPVLLSIWCFPWLTLSLLRALRENNYALAIWAAFFVFLGAGTSTILVILMVIWIVILLGYLWLTGELQWESWRQLLPFTVLSGLAVILLNWPLLQSALAGQNESFITPSQESILTDIGSIVIPPWIEWWERGMYLGLMPSLLALLLLFRGRPLGFARLGLGLTVLAYLFAIGPYPTFFETPLGITLPWSLPLSVFLRNMYRMMILMSFGWSLTAAYGWLALASLVSRRPILARSAAVVVLAAIFVDFTAAPFPFRPAVSPTFYTAGLADLSPEQAIAILPTGRQYDKFYMYYQTIHQQPMTGGVISRAGTDTQAFLQQVPMMAYAVANDSRADFSETAVADQLRRLHQAEVRYLILDKQQANEGLVTMWRDWLTIDPAYEDEALVVYNTLPLAGRDFEIHTWLTQTVGLIRAVVGSNEAVPGGTIKIDLRWGSTAAPGEDLNICFDLLPDEALRPDLQPGNERFCRPVSPAWPTGRWQGQEVVRDAHIIWLPDDLPAGGYQLAAGLAVGDKPVGETADLGQIMVLKAAPQHPNGSVWDDRITLIGYDWAEDDIDNTLDLTLFWRGLRPLERSYKIFVHVVDEKTGDLVIQYDGIPRGWTYPTTIWEPGELVRDQIELSLESLPSGRYEVYVGLYDELSGHRLTAVSPELASPQERVQLQTLSR